MHERDVRKAGKLYDYIDSSSMFKGTVRKEDRSLMNVTFVTGDETLDKKFIAEAKEQGIHGKETTPFLLARVAELTGGDSLESNIQLVLNNARVAAKTAVALCK